MFVFKADELNMCILWALPALQASVGTSQTNCVCDFFRQPSLPVSSCESVLHMDGSASRVPSAAHRHIFHICKDAAIR